MWNVANEWYMDMFNDAHRMNVYVLYCTWRVHARFYMYTYTYMHSVAKNWRLCHSYWAGSSHQSTSCIVFSRWFMSDYHQVTCLVLFYLSVSFETWSGTFLYALAWAEWPLMLFGEPWIPLGHRCFFFWSCHVMSPCGFGTWKFFVGP